MTEPTSNTADHDSSAPAEPVQAGDRHDAERGLPVPPEGVRDPWKGLRGVMAGTLVLEFIVFALALPVVWQFGPGVSSLGFGVIIALTVLMLVAAFVQRRAWGLWFALALQAAAVLCAFVHPAIGIMGVLFGAAWGYMLYLRRDVARRMRAGMLYDQLGHPPGYPEQAD